jgi:hypothetical protein
MRFLTIAMGALGLAGFTVGEAVKENVLSSHYSLTPAMSLSRWHPTVTNVPTQSIHATPVHRRELTRTSKPVCSSGSTTRLEQGQTSVCTEPATIIYDERPCATSWYKFWICTATNTRTTWDCGGRSTRWVAQIAARSTQDLGGRSQRAVARFAEPTITPAPTPAVANAATLPTPLCSFNLSMGEYICRKAAQETLPMPICSFDLKKGEYICPEVAAATPPVVAVCPEGVEMCVPRNEVAEPQTTPDVCPGVAEMCIPRNEVAVPQTTFDIDSRATTMQIVNKA